MRTVTIDVTRVETMTRRIQLNIDQEHHTVQSLEKDEVFSTLVWDEASQGYPGYWESELTDSNWEIVSITPTKEDA